MVLFTCSSHCWDDIGTLAEPNELNNLAFTQTAPARRHKIDTSQTQLTSGFGILTGGGAGLAGALLALNTQSSLTRVL